MKKKLTKQLLSLSMAAALALSSFVPASAADLTDLQESEGVLSSANEDVASGSDATGEQNVEGNKSTDAAAESSAAESGAAENGAAEGGASRTGAAQARSTENSMTETGTAETGASQASTTDNGASQTGTAETGASQASTTDNGASQAGTADDGTTEAGAAEGDMTEDALTEDPETSAADEETIENESSLLKDTENTATVNYYSFGSYYGTDDEPFYSVTIEAKEGAVYPEIVFENDDSTTPSVAGLDFVSWATSIDYYYYNEGEEQKQTYITPGTTLIQEWLDPGDVVNVYAHWTGAPLKINVIDNSGKSVFHSGESAIETFRDTQDRPYAVSFEHEGDQTGGSDYYLVLDPGYEVTGLYTDSEFYEPVSEELAEVHHDYCHLYITEDNLPERDNNGAYSFTFYAKVEQVEFELRMYPGRGQETTVYKENGKVKTFKYGDNYPERKKLPGGFTNPGEIFDGWDAYTEEGYKDTSLTKIIRYYHDNDTGKYYAAIRGRWIPEEYTIIYHLNNSKTDVKKAVKYTITSAAGSSLDLTKGSLSDDSSFTDAAALFSGWALSAKGEVVFDKGLTAEAIRKYMADKKITSLDVYAKWEGSEEFNLVINGYDTETEPQFNFADEDFSGSDYAVKEIADLTRTDKSYVGETIILTGTEFVRKGYTLTGWKYTKTVGGKTTTTSLKPAATIKETVLPESASLTAQWSLKEFTVKYNLAGGVLTDKATPTTIKYTKASQKDKAPLLNFVIDGNGAYVLKEVQDVTRTGYTFGGWRGDGMSYVYYGGDIYENLNLTAVWTPINYTIQLGGNGGTVTSPDGSSDSYAFIDAKYDVSYSLKGYKAAKDGYKFTGWVQLIDENTQKSYSTTASLRNLRTSTGTVVLTAQYSPLSYKITYNLDGGSIPKDANGKKQSNPAKYKTGDEISFVSPVKTGYIFEKWILTQKGVVEGDETAFVDLVGNKWKMVSGSEDAPSYGNFTLTAVFEEDKYNITIYTNLDDKELDPLKYPVEVPMDNIPYTSAVRFDSVMASIEHKLAENYSELAEGMSIVSFTTGQDGKGKKYVAGKEYSKLGSGTVTLYTQWSENKTQRILYALEGGSLAKRPATFKRTAATRISNPSRTGYVFTGWSLRKLDEGRPGDEYTQDEFKWTVDAKKVLTISAGNDKDVALVAGWAPISYKVMIDDAAAANTGSESGNYWYESDDVNANADYTYSPAKAGYRFGGLFTAKNGKGKMIVGEDAMTSGVVTVPGEALEALSTRNGATVKLYTCWIPVTSGIFYSEWAVKEDNVYPVYVKGETEALLPAIHVFNKDTKLPKLNVPGYTFLGWKLKGESASSYLEPTAENLGNIKATVSKGYITKINRNNTEDVWLTAVVRENTYSVKVNLGGGTYYGYSGSKAKKYTGTYTLIPAAESHDDHLMVGYAVKSFAGGNVSRKGYTLRGVYFDAKGTRPVPAEDEDFVVYDGIVTKNKGSLTVYMLWDKVVVDKPERVTAMKAADTLRVSIGGIDADEKKYEVQYSTSILFTNGTVKSALLGPGADTISIPGATGTRYYVRVREYKYDSAGNRVYSKWSTTVRAAKNE